VSSRETTSKSSYLARRVVTIEDPPADHGILDGMVNDPRLTLFVSASSMAELCLLLRVSL
jgi:hypothetical protein